MSYIFFINCYKHMKVSKGKKTKMKGIGDFMFNVYFIIS